MNKRAAILFIGLDKYSLFYERFYTSVEDNFLPDVDKHFFVFSDKDILAKNSNETLIKTESFDTPRDIKLHKFHFIKSAWDKIKQFDYVAYFDADNVVRQKIDMEMFLGHGKPLVGVVHPWGSIRESKEKFESDSNSAAYVDVEQKGLPLYHQSCFWGGEVKKIEEMVNECHESLEHDISIGHKNKNNICDEVHVNRYFVANKDQLHSLGRDYANPAEAYQSERRHTKKPFGNDIIIAHDNANQTYKHSLGLLVRQAESKNNFSFAGWAQIKDNLKATFEMLKMFKHCNPNAHVHVTNFGENDYSDICSAFKCTTNSDQSIKGWEAGNRIVKYDIWEWFQNLEEVCATHLEAHEWIVLLEDDVESFNPPKEKPLYALAGPNGPSISDELYEVIKQKYPNGDSSKRYTGCGGSLLHRESFLEAIHNVTREEWDKYVKLDDRISVYADLALSFLLMVQGFKIGVWPEFSGWRNEKKIYESAFAHGNKEFYGRKMSEADKEELNYIKYSNIYINEHAYCSPMDKFEPKGRLSCIDNQSFFSYLVAEDGVCLDVGCRNFVFSEGIKDSCSKIIAIDPAPDIQEPKDNKIIFLNQALTTINLDKVYLVRDGRLASHYTTMEKISPNSLEVPSISLETLMTVFRVKEFELIKLDCEGSEYSLMHWLAEHPVAKQISVQFHDWCNRNPYTNPEDYYDKLFVKLKENYHIYKHARSKKGENIYNYDDSLFIRKKK